MARISGNSLTKTIVPTVKMISATPNPIGLIASMWIGSRYKEPISSEDLQKFVDLSAGNELDHIRDMIYDYYPEYQGKSERAAVIDIANMVIRSNLPPLDALNFTFEISDASVAFREQLVRGRQPQNFWTQTSRTADLTSIDINMSENIEFYGGSDAVRKYKDCVDMIRRTYRELTDLGVPTEDIRLIPQGMTHRIYWMVNYRTLKTALSKRLSWIAQASLWTPIIEGIMVELRKYSPELANFLGVPEDVTIANGQVVFHKYDNENMDRYTGKDEQPSDPLWLAYHKDNEDISKFRTGDSKFYERMKSYYIRLWSDEILRILGWDRNDPSIDGPYDKFEY